jgi:acyl carrier protein
MNINLKKKEKIILEVIAKVLKLKKTQISYNLKIGQVPTWDSLNHIKIYFELKKKFKKEVELENLTQVKSVKDWIKLF